MAVRGVINEFFNLEEFQKQVTAVTDGVNKYIDLVKTAPTIRSGMGDPSKIKDTIDSMKLLADQNKEVFQTTKIIVDSQRELDKAMLQGKIQQQEYNKELKTEINLQNAATGSVNEAKSAIVALTAQRNNLNLKTEEGRKAAENINKKIDEQNEFIKQNVSLLEKQRLNIGNYQGSAKIIVEALERARSKVQQVGKEFGQASPEAQAARKEFEALERVTGNPQFLNISSKVGDTNKELRFFTQQLNTLEDAGLKNSEVYRDVRARLAQLQDQLGDTRAEIKALSSDTRQFDLFAGSVNFAADAFQTAAGAAVLFGASEEDAAAATKTLVAIQSVSNGVKGIANELTTKGTAANIAYSAVQKLVATSTDQTAAATARLSAATKLLFGGLIIGGIAYAVIKFIELKNAVSETERQSKLLRDVNKEVAKSAGEEIGKLQTLYSVSTNNNIALKERKKAVDELQETYPEYFKNVNDEIILQGKAESAYDKTRIAILENAKTRAIEAKLADLANRELEIQFDTEEKMRQKQDAQRQARINKSKKQSDIPGGPSTVTPEDFLAGELAVDVINDDLEKSNKELEQIAQDRDFLLGKITKAGVKPPPPTKDDTVKKAKELADAELRTQLEIQKIFFQQHSDFNKEIADNDKESQSARLFALRQYATAQTEIINRTALTELQIGDKTDSELTLVRKKQNDELLRLHLEVEKSRIEITKGTIAERTAITDDEKKILAEKAAAIAKNFEENEQKKRESAKKTLEERKRIAEEERKLTKTLYDELTTTITSFFTAGLERQRNRLQEEIDLLDKKREKDIEVANSESGTAQEKADKIAIIEARANSRRQQLEREQRRIQQEQAKFQKAAQIVKIIGDTASAIMATLARTPPPAGIPLAVLTGAIGAAQLATVIAQPIPKYAKGTDNHPGGLAVVGDGGKSEGVKMPDGTMLKTPDKPTLVDLPKGAQVFPDLKQLLINTAMREIPDVRVSVPYDKTEKAIKQMGKDIVRTIKQKQENHFHMPGRHDTFMREGSKFRAYLDKNL